MVRESKLNHFTFAVDLSAYPKARFTSGKFIQEGFPGEIVKTRVIDEMNWYFDEEGAALYLSVVRFDGYKTLSENLEFLERKLNLILTTFFSHFKITENMFENGISFIALGVGSAEKELTILNAIINWYNISPDEYPEIPIIDYIPLDTSFPLLQDSLSTLFADTRFKFRDRIARNHIMISPVLSDFTKLSGEDLGIHPLKLFAALGVVWNSDIGNIFDALRNLFEDLEENNKNAALLIDAEFIGNRSDQELIKSYDNEYMKKLLFHPLESLQKVATVDKHAFFSAIIEGRHESLYYHDYFKEYIYDEKRIFVEVVNHKNVDEFIKKYEFKNKYVRSVLLGGGHLKKSRTVVIVYVPKNWTRKQKAPHPILLGYSTKFDVDEFIGFIKIYGFEAIWSDIDPNNTFGYQLLTFNQKSTEPNITKIDSSSIIEDIQNICPNYKMTCSSSNLAINSITFSFIIEKTAFLSRSAIVGRITSSKTLDELTQEYHNLIVDIAKLSKKSVSHAVLWVSNSVNNNIIIELNTNKKVTVIKSISELEDLLYEFSR